MKTLLTTALATVALAATPALAQTNQGGSSQGQTQTQATQQQNQGSEQGAMSREQMAASQQRVIDTLNQAGLTDVQIMDAAYLVQATTPDDEQVIMIVNSAGQPVSAPRMGQSDETQTRQGAAQQGQSGGQSGSQTQSSN